MRTVMFTAAIVMQLDDDADAQDIADAIDARLDEFYPESMGGLAVPAWRAVSFTDSDLDQALGSLLRAVKGG